MAKIIRFGVSLDKNLLSQFDYLIHKKNYTNRSEAFRDLIRQELIKEEWQQNKEVAGTITLVYNHQQRELLNKLVNLQHHYHQQIISTQHIHLDHSNCLEIIVIKGNPRQIQKLSNALKSLKGVKHCVLNMATTGKKIQ